MKSIPYHVHHIARSTPGYYCPGCAYSPTQFPCRCVARVAVISCAAMTQALHDGVRAPPAHHRRSRAGTRQSESSEPPQFLMFLCLSPPTLLLLTSTQSLTLYFDCRTLHSVGFYCPPVAGLQTPCPAGTYGNVPGLSSSTCSGTCT